MFCAVIHEHRHGERNNQPTFVPVVPETLPSDVMGDFGLDGHLVQHVSRYNTTLCG